MTDDRLIRSESASVRGHAQVLEAYHRSPGGWYLRVLTDGVVTGLRQTSRWEQVERAFVVFGFRRQTAPPASTSPGR